MYLCIMNNKVRGALTILSAKFNSTPQGGKYASTAICNDCHPKLERTEMEGVG